MTYSTRILIKIIIKMKNVARISVELSTDLVWLFCVRAAKEKNFKGLIHSKWKFQQTKFNQSSFLSALFMVRLLLPLTTNSTTSTPTHSLSWSTALQDFPARRFDGAACKRHQLGRAIGTQKGRSWMVMRGGRAVRGSDGGRRGCHVLTGWIDGGVEVAEKGFCYAKRWTLCSRSSFMPPQHWMTRFYYRAVCSWSRGGAERRRWFRLKSSLHCTSRKCWK